jgi:hypothetical protein
MARQLFGTSVKCMKSGSRAWKGNRNRKSAAYEAERAEEQMNKAEGGGF